MTIIVGLCGGCSYINIYYMIGTDETLKPKEKEIATSYSAVFTNLGILTAMSMGLLLTNTILKI